MIDKKRVISLDTFSLEFEADIFFVMRKRSVT